MEITHNQIHSQQHKSTADYTVQKKPGHPGSTHLSAPGSQLLLGSSASQQKQSSEREELKFFGAPEDKKWNS